MFSVVAARITKNAPDKEAVLNIREKRSCIAWRM